MVPGCRYGFLLTGWICSSTWPTRFLLITVKRWYADKYATVVYSQVQHQNNIIGWVQRENCFKHPKYAAGITYIFGWIISPYFNYPCPAALSHENDIPHCPLPSSSQPPDRLDVKILQRTFRSDRRFGNGLDARHKIRVVTSLLTNNLFKWIKRRSSL